jgi:hypothetical protein
LQASLVPQHHRDPLHSRPSLLLCLSDCPWQHAAITGGGGGGGGGGGSSLHGFNHVQYSSGVLFWEPAHATAEAPCSAAHLGGVPLAAGPLGWGPLIKRIPKIYKNLYKIRTNFGLKNLKE